MLLFFVPHTTSLVSPPPQPRRAAQMCARHCIAVTREAINTLKFYNSVVNIQVTHFIYALLILLPANTKHATKPVFY